MTSGTGVLGFRVAVSLLEAGHKDVRVGIWKGDRDDNPASFGEQCAKILEEKGAEVVSNQIDLAIARATPAVTHMIPYLHAPRLSSIGRIKPNTMPRFGM